MHTRFRKSFAKVPDPFFAFFAKEGCDSVKKDMGMKDRTWKAVCGNALLLGVLSLIWLVLRSGRKPTRINYPCQRAALANSAVLLTGLSVPLAARLPRTFLPGLERPLIGKLLRAVELAGILALAVLLAVSVPGLMRGRATGGGRSMGEMRAAAAALTVPALRSAARDASNIYVAEGIGPASEQGVDTLIDVMDANGLDFFRSGASGRAASAQGLVGGNDIVLIKVNGEWRWRGGTNTDVVKGLVKAIVNHPDGFTGEVVIVENGQWDSYMDNRTDNRNPSACNAQDVTQSFNDVATMFAGKHRVSVYDWTAIQTRAVGEFANGDTRDGYVYAPEMEMGYPKFTTVYGTRVSLRHGYWDGSRYDNSRVKFLNVPVLKDHGLTGVTCSVKHFMGVQDLWRMTQDPPHGPMVTDGLFGKLMLVARYPDLNIADAIWVTPAGGPNGPYETAVRVDRLLASQDPIALDYYCGKYVLMPISGNGRHDPNNQNAANSYNAFHQMLESTRAVLEAGGRHVTMDEGRMAVLKGTPPEELPRTGHECWLAEGCTGYGFETWVLIANPNDTPATVYVSYLTGQGVRNRDPVKVPAHSRLTLNASADVWQQSAGIRVGSDIPVFDERAMYWGDRIEGHDSIGTASGATTWYLAEGCTDYGFETWVEILNPGGYEAEASVTYLTTAGPVAGPTIAIPPYSRGTVSANETAPKGDVSVLVESDRPVVVERSMYWDSRRGGSGSSGVKQPASDWYLAEGATHSGFETYLLVLNPGAKAETVDVELMTAGSGAGSETAGASPKKIRLAVPAMSRKTLRVNDVIPGADVSIHVRAKSPVVAERSMYWPGGASGKAGHSTVGTSAPATSTFLPEGCTAWGFETWLLVGNPSADGAKVNVYAMTEGGEKEVCALEVPPCGRRTVRVNDYYQGNLSLRVESTVPLVCERAVYWGGRSGGTCSTGYVR